MLKITNGLVVLLFISLATAWGQNYYESPYSRFGIGDLLNTGVAYNQSFGGASVALRPHNVLNYLNPASFTNQDTLSFLFQTGFIGRSKQLEVPEGTLVRSNMNLQNLSIGFPITKWFNASVGLHPYSSIQYNYESNGLESETENVVHSYVGEGGFSEFYFGAAFEYKELFSIGLTASYLFGDLIRSTSVYIVDKNSAIYNTKDDFIANDFFYRLGIQAHPVIAEKHQIIAGAAYESEMVIKIAQDQLTEHLYEYTRNTYFGTTNDTSFVSSLQLPAKVTVGLGYVYNNQITATVEYMTQAWSESNLPTKLQDYTSIRGGVSYRPKALTSRDRAKYPAFVEYRLGARKTQTYVVLNGQSIDETAVSVGLGLPWKNSRNQFTGTTFNISYEYSTRGTTNNSLVKETSHIISVGLVLHDFWFLKPKYE